MPQLDFTVFPMQLFWLFVTFVVFYVLMAKVGLPRVGAALDARAAKIDGDLAAATVARDQIAALAEAHEKRIAEAREQSRIILKTAFDEMQAEASKREAEISAQLGAESKAADLRIAEAKHQALGQLRDVAASAVAQATERLIGEGIPEAEINAAVDRVIGGRRS
jgi:F-type H+-transporting ATPase subunit b